MAKKRTGLGKGLSALIPDQPINNDNIDNKASIEEIDITFIEPNKEQPRREFNSVKLNELAESIKIHGVIQPIIVRKKEEGYELIAGERRWRASKQAGLKRIPCIIREIEQLDSTKIALIENIQRENLNPIEEALAYKSLVEKHELTQEKISEIVGKSRSYITNLLRLLNLDKRVIGLIMKGEITSGHGRTLLAVENKEVQYKLAKSIIEKSLSVRETEKLVKNLSENKKNKNKKDNSVDDPIISGIEESLRKTLGTKVKIVKGRKKSKIEIEYYSEEDLDRILDVLSIN
ncbi:ParB/RepB/Spo0J family partition protein [Sporosalibacterium faouarense]|uniref:ParB/RepB/Spo0J family partition protein n=1 Tax=Sporosalibacterium faouarense TaxID=516123 RepID=UPI00192C9B53|nr:ParB/RepB/Spo0J family partition protein [Sporosalibacterium faouarense]